MRSWVLMIELKVSDIERDHLHGVGVGLTRALLLYMQLYSMTLHSAALRAHSHAAAPVAKKHLAGLADACLMTWSAGADRRPPRST